MAYRLSPWHGSETVGMAWLTGCRLSSQPSSQTLSQPSSQPSTQPSSQRETWSDKITIFNINVTLLHCLCALNSVRLWRALALLCEVAYVVIISIQIYITCLSVPCCLCDGAWLAVLWDGGRPIAWRGVLCRGLCWRAVHCSGLAVPFCGMV